MSNFVLTDRKTDYLLPPSVEDWLTQDHLARFVVEVIDGLDLSRLTRQYAGRGSKVYHPATLLALLVYGYSTDVFSSRKLERAGSPPWPMPKPRLQRARKSATPARKPSLMRR